MSGNSVLAASLCNFMSGTFDVPAYEPCMPCWKVRSATCSSL